MNKKKNYFWLDFLKGVAMIAVVLDHLYYYYHNQLVQHHTGFHVSLFILLAGFTSAISIQNRGESVNFSHILKRLYKTFIPYLVASLVYCFYNNIFNPFTILEKIITFRASGQLYFVLFYLQLVAISSLIYKLVNHQKSKFLDIPIIILSYFTAQGLNKFKIFPSFYGGSAHLFGGSFLFLYLLGFFIKKYQNFFENKKTTIAMLITSLFSLFSLESLNLISKAWSNPANNFLILYCLTIFSLLYSISKLLLFRFPKLISFITLIGKHSFYVFLYHTLIISIFSKYLLFTNNNQLATTIYLLLAATLLPSLISYLKDYSKVKKLKNS